MLFRLFGRIRRLRAKREKIIVDVQAADLENQVAAVLHLIVVVLVMKPALFLLLQIERETQTGSINPTLAGRLQPPYSPLLGQGVCDLRQARGVRDMSKTISFLCKVDPGFACLAGHVLMAEQG